MSLPYTSTYDGEEAGSIIPILVLSRACVLIDPTEHVCLRAEDETAERIDATRQLSASTPRYASSAHPATFQVLALTTTPLHDLTVEVFVATVLVSPIPALAIKMSGRWARNPGQLDVGSTVSLGPLTPLQHP